ncbi:phosphate--AMP phosphotransferase, partial [Phascolarctobacterium succinatutens]
KKNIAKNAKTLGKAWRDLNPALDESEDYDKFLPHYEKMLEATDTVNAPWHLIADDDPRSARLEVFTKIADAIEKAVQMPVEPASDKRTAATYDVLSKIDANKELTKEEYKEKLDKYQKKLTQLQIEMFKAQIPVVIGFEGWDAAGKGGAIRRLTAALDPLGFHVHPIAAPNVVEKQFHYQWRFWTKLPQPGNIAIFDRTWYGRVMVERIEGFAKPQEWQRAYDEIKDMEAQWSEHGIAIAKFWLQIDKDEQLRRFNDRQADPNKQWKITDEDWRNRDKWDAYEAAVNEMLVRTDTSYAPWTVVEGNNKYYARLKVLKTVIDLFERKLAEKQQ